MLSRVAVSQTEPLVSIITPAFNSRRYLAEAVASVLTQTFADFELLIVDDGSDDTTLELARSFEQADPRVHVFTQKNRGTSAARNLAMRHGRGVYFALLDSDDVWQPTFLETELALFKQYPDADIVMGNALNVGGDFDGRPLLPIDSHHRWLSLLDVIEREDSVSIMSVFRRAVPGRIGGFDESYRFNEDYEFWIRAAHAGFRFLVNPMPLAYYRRSAASKSAEDTSIIGGILRVFEQARVLCHDRPDVVAAIDRQIRRFEAQRRLARAKASLQRREFDAAAREFEAWSMLQDSFSADLMARISRRVPQALLWAYRARTAFRAGGRRLWSRA